MKTAPVKKRSGVEPIITFTALGLIATGAFFMHRYLEQTTFQSVEASAATKGPSESLKLGRPIALSVSKINLSLSVKHGGINPETNQWALDNKHAFYINDSATPVIYGHNQKGVFDQLSRLRGGEALTVTTDDGRELKFIFSKSRQINANDGAILKEINPETIILLTCSGTFYEFRQALYFTYVGER